MDDHYSKAEYWYRYNDYEAEDSNGMIVIKVVLYTYHVIKHTKKGVWIAHSYSSKRFILTDARKKYACPTIEEAKKSFVARKIRQKKILTRNLRRVKMALEQIYDVKCQTKTDEVGDVDLLETWEVFKLLGKNFEPR
jgi:hypothetical protein